MSSRPIWSGIRRSIVNCSRGWSSIATSFLVVAPLVLRASAAGDLIERPRTDRHLDAGDRAIDAQHAGADPEEEQHDRSPGARPQPAIDRPTQSGANDDRDHEFDTDAETKPGTLLQGGVVGLRYRRVTAAPGPRLVEPLAKPCQRVRRPAVTHFGKRNTAHSGRHGRNGAHHSKAPCGCQPAVMPHPERCFAAFSAR